MIRHVVVFSWLPGATDDQKRHAIARIATLPPLMTGLVSYRYGVDIGVAEGNADFAITADFDDRAAYLAYRDHPAHVDVIQHAMRPITAQRLAVQFEV
jgi:hypothetical protein